MRVKVSSLTAESFYKKETIPAVSWDMNGFDTEFVDNIDLECSFQRIKDYILVDLTVITRKIITCARCLNNVGQRVTKQYHLEYSVANLGQDLDIDQDIRQEILLDFPFILLCEDGCKGIKMKRNIKN